MRPTLGQVLLGINAALIAANTYLATLNSLSEETRVILAFAIAVALAFLGPILPAMSLSVRRALNLQSSGK